MNENVQLQSFTMKRWNVNHRERQDRRRRQQKHQGQDISHTRPSRKFPVKRIAVKKAHNDVCKLLRTRNIPHVKKTFGSKILRLCCRTIAQLENIGLILKHLIKFGLIEELGMPLVYAYKMKTLVLFLKPTTVDASLKLQRVFQACTCEYHFQFIEVQDPTENEKVSFEDNAVNDPPEFNENALCKSPSESSMSESPSEASTVEKSPSPAAEKSPSPAVEKSPSPAVEKSLSHSKDTTDDQDQVNDIWIACISIFALFSTLIIWEFYY